MAPTPRFESPALAEHTLAAPAYEVKFLLGEDMAREVENLLRPRLLLDAHADPALRDAYRITSVYFDTPQYDVYHRSEGMRARKYRVRRYGAGPTAFLERKTKRGQQVKKRRTAVPLEELEASLLAGEAQPGAWFARQLLLRQLRPVCRVSYERIALVGAAPEGPIRATFDRAARGLPADGPFPEPVTEGAALLSGEVIVEFKFLGAMPGLFKEAIAALRLTPRSGSKYRRCVDALQLLTARNGAHA